MVPELTAVFAPGSAQMNYTVNSGARRSGVDKKVYLLQNIFMPLAVPA